ncbi:MAG: hypothetical protein WBL53_23560, partial [Pseudonocardiaceae bacterium]
MKPLRSTDDTRWPATSMAFGRHRLSVEVFPWSLLRTPGLPAETLAPMADLAAMDAATRLLRDDPVKALAEGFEAVHLPNAYR